MDQTLIALLLDSGLIRDLLASFAYPVGIAINKQLKLQNKALREEFSQKGGNKAIVGTEFSSLSDIKEIFGDKIDVHGFYHNGLEIDIVYSPEGIGKRPSSPGQYIGSLKNALLLLIEEFISNDNIDMYSKAINFSLLNVNFVIYGPDSISALLASLIIALGNVRNFLTLDLREVKPNDQQAKLADLLNQSVLSAGNGGCLLLKNIHLLSPRLQNELATIIERGEIGDPVKGMGGRLNFQIISTTSQDLALMAQDGKFSIPLLKTIQNFIIDCHAPCKNIRDGNASTEQVRGLTLHALDDSNHCVFEEVATDRTQEEDSGNNTDDAAEDLNMEKWLEAAEKDCIMKALARTGNRKDKAAALLGMNLRTFHRRCLKLGL